MRKDKKEKKQKNMFVANQVPRYTSNFCDDPLFRLFIALIALLFLWYNTFSSYESMSTQDIQAVAEQMNELYVKAYCRQAQSKQSVENLKKIVDLLLKQQRQYVLANNDFKQTKQQLKSLNYEFPFTRIGNMTDLFYILSLVQNSKLTTPKIKSIYQKTIYFLFQDNQYKRIQSIFLINGQNKNQWSWKNNCQACRMTVKGNNMIIPGTIFYYNTNQSPQQLQVIGLTIDNQRSVIKATKICSIRLVYGKNRFKCDPQNQYSAILFQTKNMQVRQLGIKPYIYKQSYL